MNWIEELRYDISRIHTREKELKKFGVMIGSIFLVVASVITWNKWFNEPVIYSIYISGIVLLITGFVVPRYLKNIFLIWMGTAIVIGSVVSRLILFIIFFVILTPISISAKMFNKTFVIRYKDQQLQSYWIKRSESKKINYEQMH